MAYLEEKKSQATDTGYHVEQAYTTVDEQETTRRASEVLLNHENLSYGSSGLKGIIESPYVCAAAFLASMGGFSFGYGTLFVSRDTLDRTNYNQQIKVLYHLSSRCPSFTINIHESGPVALVMDSIQVS